MGRTETTEPVLYVAMKPWQRVASPLRLFTLSVAVLTIAVLLVVATRAENQAGQEHLAARIDSLCLATATILAQTGFVAGDAAMRSGSPVHAWQLEDVTQVRAALGCPGP